MSKKSKKRKNRNRRRQMMAVYLTAVVLAAAAVGAGLIGAFWSGSGETAQEGLATVKTADSRDETKLLQEETAGIDDGTETGETVAAADDGTKTDETVTGTEAETENLTESLPEPEVYVELTEENRDDFVKVKSCEIRAGSDTFVFSGSVEEKPASDDDQFYLFEMKMYDTELNQEGAYIDSVPKAREFSLEAMVNENSAESRLFSKFVVAVKLDGSYVPLCEPQYITNPEALASYAAAFPEGGSIKGLLVDPAKIRGSELDDLGVEHAAYNIFVSNILGETTNGNYPTIYYTYNGRTYAFNGQRIAEYDLVFSTLTQKGITISAILLNNNNGTQPQLIHPLSRNGSGNYYAFNTAEEDGIQTMAAVGAFLAKRYRSSEHGVVMNWIVGNEVNVRTDWNYMQQVDLGTYAGEYAKAVRVFYNSIKSMNANARIYASMDQQWDRNLKNNQNYDVKDMLLSMNETIREEGNIEWGLAHHPYALPLTDTTFWDVSSNYRKLIQHSDNTSFVTMENISVVTNFMQQEHMLTADGEVRPIILSELGFSSTKGEANQAAAFAYAYYVAEANPHIDALILSRQTDAPEEIAQDLALGVTETNGRRKYIYEVFKHIDGPNSAAVTEFAKPIIGISSWSEIGAAH